MSCPKDDVLAQITSSVARYKTVGGSLQELALILMVKGEPTAADALGGLRKMTPKLARIRFQLAIAMLKTKNNRTRWLASAKQAIHLYAKTGGSKTGLAALKKHLSQTR